MHRAKVCSNAMNIDWSPFQKAIAPVWEKISELFERHHFITIVCAFFAVMMTISFYKFLKSISPALVAFVLILIVVLLIMHWTFTRTEPEILTPFIDWLAPFFPTMAPPPPMPPLKK